MSENDNPVVLNHAANNTQQDAFVISSDQGVKVFNIQPLKLLKSIDSEITGNARLSRMLHRSNLSCFVGGGKNVKYPSNTALIYDDSKKKIVLEYTVPGGPILNVLMSRSRVVIVQERKIHIFDFPNKSRLIRAEEIRPNPMGLADLSTDELAGQMLAFPGFALGTVRLMNLKTLNEYESVAPITIEAHYSEISQIALNNQGTLVATGSEKGTVIKVFETRTQTLLCDLRRGNIQAKLHCISFSPCSSFLAVSSDKGTVHVFGIRSEDQKVSMLKNVVMKGAPSIAQISIKQRVLCLGFNKATTKSLQSLTIICADGSYHRFSYEANKSPTREAFELLPQLAGEQEFWIKPV